MVLFSLAGVERQYPSVLVNFPRSSLNGVLCFSLASCLATNFYSGSEFHTLSLFSLIV